MPITLPSTFTPEMEKPHGEEPFVWFVDLELNRPYLSGETVMPSTMLRVCSYHEDLTWPDSHPDAIVWDAYRFTFSPIEQTREGDLPQLQLNVDNSARLLMPYLHDGDGFEGNLCQLFLVPFDALDVAYPNHEFQLWQLRVSSAFASGDSVTFVLERPNFFEKKAPQDRFVASRCRWAFGGDECGYPVNAVANYTTCAKTIQDCINRGLDEASRGIPVLHPRRFGGFPGVPRQQ